MKIDEQAQGSTTVLVAHGPLIGDELPDLRRAVEKASEVKSRRLVVDMADVPYLDSSGIELLLELFGMHVSSLTRPKLAAVSDTCMEALELTDVLPRIEVFDTVENALRSCQQR